VLVDLHDPLVLLRTLHCQLYYLLLAFHLLKFYLLLLLCHLHKQQVSHECQRDSLVAVTTCPSHTVDVGGRAHLLLVLNGLAVVNDQGHCPNVDTSADGFGAEHDL
jgi:hypothetical protein